jgi:hypothetical protein
MEWPKDGCYFCGQEAIGVFVVSSLKPEAQATGAKKPGSWSELSLCQRHHAILEEAGPHGRIWQVAGERWWLGRW